MSSKMKILVVVCVLFVIGKTKGESYADIRRLHDDLVKSYDKLHRPVRNPDEALTVEFQLHLVNLYLSDEKQRITAVTNLAISWKDDYMQWNPEDYGNTKNIHVDSSEIWIPDIALLNSASKISIVPVGNIPVSVTNTGKVTWRPPFTGEVPCSFNLYKWPSDTQVCSFMFSSWTHQGDQLDLHLQNDNSSVVLDKYIENNQWKLTQSVASRRLTTYDDAIYINVAFTVKRLGSSRVRYISHTTVAVLIAVLLSYILPISFHLSRLVIHLFSLSILILCDLVLYLSLPAGGGPLPQIVAYYSGTIVLTCMSLVVNVLLTTASYMSGPQKLLRIKLASLLPFSKSVNGLISEEVGYMHLQEEMTTFDERNNCNRHEDQPVAQEAVPPPQRQEGLPKNKVPSITIQRLINGVFFFLFATAYLIDYSILVASVIEK